VRLISLMSPHKIDIAKYLSKLESKDMRNPLAAMESCLEGLAGELKTSLHYKENLETIDGEAPLLKSYSTEQMPFWPLHGPSGYLCRNLGILSTTIIKKKVEQVLMPGLPLHTFDILSWMR
jgi:hypothetical protein